MERQIAERVPSRPAVTGPRMNSDLDTRIDPWFDDFLFGTKVSVWDRGFVQWSEIPFNKLKISILDPSSLHLAAVSRGSRRRCACWNWFIRCISTPRVPLPRTNMCVNLACISIYPYYRFSESVLDPEI